MVTPTCAGARGAQRLRITIVSGSYGVQTAGYGSEHLFQSLGRRAQTMINNGKGGLMKRAVEYS
jgi:hypothetical protein